MNWNATQLNETVPVALALIKLPAVVPITDVCISAPLTVAREMLICFSLVMAALSFSIQEDLVDLASAW